MKRLKLSLKDFYPLFASDEGGRKVRFAAKTRTGIEQTMEIRVSEHASPLFPNVYNIAFGLLNEFNRIEDNWRVRHMDSSKLFSTILVFVLGYLNRNRTHKISIEGLDGLRMAYYWRIIAENISLLSQNFNIYGLKYYVKFSKFKKSHYENPFDFEDILPVMIPIDKLESSDIDDCNFIIVGLKSV